MDKLTTVILSYYRTKANKTQRLGQYYINHFVDTKDLPWPQLFYETNNKVIIKLIENHINTKQKNVDP